MEIKVIVAFVLEKMDVNNATAVRKMEFTTVQRDKECIQLVDEVTVLALSS